MKNLKAILVSAVAVLMVSCGTTRTVPLTGRQQNLMVEDGQILSLATQQYQEFMKSAKLSTNAANTAMVKRVGQNLANAVVNYLNTAGLSSEVANYKWTFNLVQDKQVNAWCMPGGLICVYEGLLPVTQDEASLAIVLGHEIAHAVARHSAEQMSTQIKQQYGMQIGAAVLGQVGMGANTSAII
ncbi:MAG: M48 family metalloprotease, partial [Prevotella sp.]